MSDRSNQDSMRERPVRPCYAICGGKLVAVEAMDGSCIEAEKCDKCGKRWWFDPPKSHAEFLALGGVSERPEANEVQSAPPRYLRDKHELTHLLNAKGIDNAVGLPDWELASRILGYPAIYGALAEKDWMLDCIRGILDANGAPTHDAGGNGYSTSGRLAAYMKQLRDAKAGGP